VVVPAGSYAVTGKVGVANLSSADAANLTCKIDAGGVQADAALTTIPPRNPNPESDALPLTGVVTLDHTASISIQCTVGSNGGASTPTGSASAGRIVAVEVNAT
jgi:hypothetical protein